MAPPAPDGGVASEPRALRELFGFHLDTDTWFARVAECSRPATLGRLGPYELLAELGRGGQGVVYKARQPRTGREVALKRPAAGVFATPQMRARVEREIDAAAALDHPNIVTLYGTELIDDQPVLTMQWIDGVPFDRWAGLPDGSRRDVRAILTVFLQVCDAIRHAHQRGVIHRDIKPSNIFVDAQDRPFVMDFGLAKLASDAAGSLTMTRTGDFVGTPSYAAPEQVRGDVRAIDVRTDVYALGVVLYQALTGRLPFDANIPVQRLLERIQFDDPPAPSRVYPALGRELDAILLKALAKENNERYASVAALADDLRRHLAGQVVLAHAPSGLYRARKFVRRHRLAVGVALGFVTLLLGATAVSTTYYLRAAAALRAEQQEHARAETALLAEREQRERVAQEQAHAQREAEKTAAINRFVADMLKHADPAAQQGRANITIRAALDAASQRLISGQAQYDPEVEADLRMAIGEIYSSLTLFEPAKSHFQAALEIKKQVFGAESEAVAATLNFLGRAYRGQARYADAEEMQRASLALRRKLLPPDSPYLAQALSSLAVTLRPQGKYADAEVLYREALAIYARCFGADDENVGIVCSALGVVLTFQDRLDEAAEVLQRALDVAHKHHGDADHGDTATAQFNLAAVRWRQGCHAEAECLAREAIAAQHRLYGDPHAHTANQEQMLASWLSEVERWTDAEPLYRSSLAAQETLFGDNHGATIGSLQGLATVLRQLGRWNEAEVYARRAAAGQEAVDPGGAHGAKLRVALAESLWHLGRFDEAAELLAAAWQHFNEAGDAAGKQQVAARFSELYEAWDRAEPELAHDQSAAMWRKRQAELESAATATQPTAIDS